MSIKFLDKSKQILLLLVGCTVLTGCTSVQFPNLQQMLITAGTSLPAIWQFVTALAYLLGMGFIMRGVYALKVYGEMRSMSSSSTSLKVPLTYLMIGAALMFLPSTKSVLMTTIFAYGDQMPLSYTTSNPLWSSQATQVLLQIVQLIGLISFIRGWVYLAHGQQGGQSQFGKAMTHIIGGILAINIEGTREILTATFGVNT